MKDLKRYSLLGAIFIVLFMLLLEWNKFSKTIEQSSGPTEETISSGLLDDTNSSIDIAEENKSNTDEDIPMAEQADPEPAVTTKKETTLIEINTDVLNVKIDLLGGDIVMVTLPTHWAALDTPEIPFELLNRTSNKEYIAQSGLIGKNGTDSSGKRPLFNTEKNQYKLADGENSLYVDLVLGQTNNVSIVKRFIFTRGEYLIEIQYQIENRSSETWQASFFGQIKRDDSVPKNTATGLQPFLGAATSTEDEPYLKMDFEDIEDYGSTGYKQTNTGSWIAFVQHYFVSAWIGNADEQNTYRAKKNKNADRYIMGYTGPVITIQPKSSGVINSRFYAGPKITQRLEEFAPYLDLTVDYGWLWWVAKPIHWVLQLTQTLMNNWGWSIVLLTIIIKIILFPLSHKAYISMGHMRKVAPKMALLRDQYGDNRQKLQEEMMKLYKTEKINPLGGCLPMLLQMPVFISLYWVLMESVELRHAPFVGWIEDLSVMDPYFCLPILMGLSMYFQQKMNPAPPDPTQAKVMQWLPIIFTFMFLWFPAGLVLYWLVNNITSMIHQAYINKQVESGNL